MKIVRAFVAVSMRFLLLFLATTTAFKIPLDVVSVTPSTDSAAVVSPDAPPTPSPSQTATPSRSPSAAP